MIDDPKRHCERRGYPCIRRVFRAQVTLNNLFAFFQAAVHFRQKIQMDEVIRVEHAKSVVFNTCFINLMKQPVHRIAFADLLLIESFIDDGAVISSELRGTVSAVVGDDIDIVKFTRIFQHEKIINQRTQYLLFIVGGNDNGETIFRRQDLDLFFAEHARNSQERVVHREQRHDDLDGYHDDIHVIGHTTLSFRRIDPIDSKLYLKCRIRST